MISLNLVNIPKKPKILTYGWADHYCKWNRGKSECIYISMKNNNFVCTKGTVFENIIAEEYQINLTGNSETKMPEGNNCPGYDPDQDMFYDCDDY